MKAARSESACGSSAHSRVAQIAREDTKRESCTTLFTEKRTGGHHIDVIGKKTAEKALQAAHASGKIRATTITIRQALASISGYTCNNKKLRRKMSHPNLKRSVSGAAADGNTGDGALHLLVTG